MALIHEYHKRSDHGRDGTVFGDEPICNCVELFAEFVGEVRTLLSINIMRSVLDAQDEARGAGLDDTVWFQGWLAGMEDADYLVSSIVKDHK